MLRLMLLVPMLLKMLLLQDPAPTPDPKPDPPPDPKPDPAPDPKPDPAPDPNLGFPENTPVAEMSTAQQAAYWKHHSRKHEQRAREREDYDAIKAERDQLKQQTMTDQERAVEQAKEEAKAEGRREAAVNMVDVHVEAAVTAGRITEDRAKVLLDGLDRTKFLTEDGTKVDAAKVKTLLDSIAPANGKGFPDLGQGRRPGTAKAGVAAGREMYESSTTKKS